MRLLVINGPNLNLLGTREPEIYGSDTLADLEGMWRRHGTSIGIGVDTFQSNHEGAIIDEIQAAGPRHDGIVINAAALTHYSYAIYDALVAINVPVVEVHISDIHEREEWRHTSVISPAAERVIVGRGTQGYLDAINLLTARDHFPPTTVAYGDQPDQVFDLRIPDQPIGLVCLLHGGFWRTTWERDTMDPLAATLASDGYATANIEYRRGHASFRTSQHDVAAGVSSAIDCVARDGHGQVPVTVVGHSAGGYLAMRFGEDHPDLAVVALSPVIDLESISAARPGDDPVAAFLGSDPASGDAALTGRNPAQVTIIHGALDSDIPVEHSQSFHSVHPDSTFVPLEDADHMSLINPRHPASGALASAIARR